MNDIEYSHDSISKQLCDLIRRRVDPLRLLNLILLIALEIDNRPDPLKTEESTYSASEQDVLCT